jgi:hypothetical protein
MEKKINKACWAARIEWVRRQSDILKLTLARALGFCWRKRIIPLTKALQSNSYETANIIWLFVVMYRLCLRAYVSRPGRHKARINVFNPG